LHCNTFSQWTGNKTLCIIMSSFYTRILFETPF
jgi:hypothetical protein